MRIFCIWYYQILISNKKLCLAYVKSVFKKNLFYKEFNFLAWILNKIIKITEVVGSILSNVMDPYNSYYKYVSLKSTKPVCILLFLIPAIQVKLYLISRFASVCCKLRRPHIFQKVDRTFMGCHVYLDSMKSPCTRKISQ